jgi:hypothetical protein
MEEQNEIREYILIKVRVMRAIYKNESFHAKLKVPLNGFLKI